MANFETQPVTVFFDGSCPLCRREIDFYRGRSGADAVLWEDVSANGTVRCELETCDLLSRFHVRGSNGTLYSGARAFAEMWTALPRFRWLGLIVKTPPFVWLFEGLYRIFLIIRPLLQRFARGLDN